ncbi:MAG: hypothetical protein ACTSRA_10930 [Promethearchaeota archaeon]
MANETKNGNGFMRKKRIMNSTGFKCLFIAGFLLIGVLAGFWISSNNGIQSTNISEDPDYPAHVMYINGLQDSFNLSGSVQYVKYFANRSVQVNNTPATSNLTISAISLDSVLTSANATFRFDKAEFETNYTIEDNSGFDLPFNRTGTLEPNETGIIIGQENASFPVSNLNNVSYWEISSENVSGMNWVNLTFTFNSSITYPNSIRHDYLISAYFNASVSLNIYVYDFHNGNGYVKQNKAPINFNATTWYDDFDLSFVDNHSQSLNDSLSTQFINITLSFNSTESFHARLKNVTAEIFAAREVEISKDNWVGLSFDLRGNANVSGVWLWIRTLNLSSNEDLNFTLMYADNSSITPNGIKETLDHPLNQRPNGTIITSFIVPSTNYTNDSLSYFRFPTQQYLKTGNYFLIINSTGNQSRYSVLVIPWYDGYGSTDPENADDPDATEDHTFVVSTNNGSSWEKYMVNIEKYSLNEEVDAAPFLVQLSRELIPSDLNMSIGNVSLVDYSMDPDGFYNESNFEWGRGTWNPVNQSYGVVNGTDYILEFRWNTSIQANFSYNATCNISVYSSENSTSICTLQVDNEPRWTLLFNFSHERHTGWFSAGRVYELNETHKEYMVSEEDINTLDNDTQNGIYKFIFESPNYIKSIQTYLNFKNGEFLIPSSDFMDGDRMSVSIFVNASEAKPVYNGEVNFILFNENDIAIPSIGSSSVINNTQNFTTEYRFNNSILYHFTSSNASGNYKGRGYWFNGSEAGILDVDVYKIDYQVTEIQTQDLLDENKTQIFGTYETGIGSAINTTITHASLNKYNKIPLTLNASYNFSAFILNEFYQSETVFNPDENLTVTINVSSLELSALTHQFEACVEIYQHQNPDRVLMNMTMPTSMTLNYSGGTNSTLIINFTQSIPNGYEGYNAPVRNALFQARVKFFLDGHYYGQWTDESTFSILVNKSSVDLDGTLISVKINPNKTGSTFSQKFDRANETLLGQETLYFVLLESEDGVTLPTPVYVSTTNQMMSDFENVSIIPLQNQILAVNNEINITGSLVLENGTLYPNDTIVTVDVNINNTWEPLNTTTTGNNLISVTGGEFNTTFKLPSTYMKILQIKLEWNGVQGQINGTSTIINATMINMLANLSITSEAQKIEIFGDKKNFYLFKVENTGNTTLVFNSTPVLSSETLSLITFEPTVLTQWIPGQAKELKPGECFFFELNLLTPEPGIGKSIEGNFSITIVPYSIETKECVQFIETFDATAKSVNLVNRLATVWYLLYFFVLFVLFIITLSFLSRIKKMATKPVEEGALAKEKGEAVKKPRKREVAIVTKPAGLKKKKKESSKKGYKDVTAAIKQIEKDFDLESEENESDES